MPSIFNKSGLEPLQMTVLIKEDEVEETTGKLGLIILPDEGKERSQYQCHTGVVLENALHAYRGTEFGYDENELATHVAQPGDRIIYKKHSGTPVKSPVDSEEYRLVSDMDILCIIERGHLARLAEEKNG